MDNLPPYSHLVGVWCYWRNVQRFFPKITLFKWNLMSESLNLMYSDLRTYSFFQLSSSWEINGIFFITQEEHANVAEIKGKSAKSLISTRRTMKF